jgi:cell division protease FtsH
MAGRSAEEVAFSQKTSAAQGDIVQATAIAINMICKWGMSDSVGPQAIVLDGADFLGGGGQHYEMSDKTSELVDFEIKQLLEQCSAEATTIIKEQFYLLKQLAAILLKVETIDDEEFEIIMACRFTDQIAAGINEMAQCRNCPAKDSCIHSKVKKD